MTISGRTRIYGVVGHPVRHSLSPLIHNTWIAEHGLDAVYVALELESDAASDDFDVYYRSGMAGLNITAPHKLMALSSAVDASPLATRIGAANTLTKSRHGWTADNTDVFGFLQALQSATSDQNVSGAQVLMIGAGGAARAAVCALHDDGADLTVVNRTQDKAIRLVDELAPGASTAPIEDLVDLIRSADIVVNATSMGHTGGQEFPLGEGRNRLLFDLTYGKASEPLVLQARQAGWRTEDGLRMLVEQARASFRIWNDIDPDVNAVLSDCRAQVGAVT